MPGYLRYPHLHDDLLTFVAEDDVWIAPLSGGRAWRLSADGVPVSHPRFSPDGRWVAWTSRREGEPEVHIAPAEGGESRRLTYWGSMQTRVCGWTPAGEILAVTSWRQAHHRHTHAYAVPVDGEPARPMNWGPVGGSRPVGWRSGGDRHRSRAGARRVEALPGRRDGTAVGLGRRRLHASAGGPAWQPRLPGVGRRTAGVPVRPRRGRAPVLQRARRLGPAPARRGAGLLRPARERRRRACGLPTGGRALARGRRSTRSRPASTSASRARARPGGRVRSTHGSGRCPCDHTGRASAVEVRGGVYWIAHRDGPARVLAATPGVRAAGCRRCSARRTRSCG